jgi:hypothetical protein
VFDTNALLTLLLGGGAAATFSLVVKGITALRQGASARARESLSDLVRLRQEAEAAREKAEDERNCSERQMYEWRVYAGGLEYQLARNGIPIPDSLKRPEHRG